jgi:hypothetical protein
MSDANFYKLLGVGRSASVDEIRSAYRKLVKKHHPDLFTSTGGKAAATEKLRLINEAYAVLGNAERRQRYDQELIQRQQPPPRASAAAARRKTPRPPRRQPELRRKTTKMPKLRLHFSRKWAGYSFAAATMIMVLIYAGRTEPRLTRAWSLWEKLEVLPATTAPSIGENSQGWVRLGEHASVAECAAMLKKIVRDDERTGSKAVFDEKNGTMAITVYVKSEGTQTRDNSKPETNREDSPTIEGAPKGGEPQLSAQKSAEPVPAAGMTKRVRNLECRVTQRWETESWFRGAMRKIGLLA